MGAFDTEDKGIYWWMWCIGGLILLGVAIKGAVTIGLSLADNQSQLREEISAADSAIHSLQSQIANGKIDLADLDYKNDKRRRFDRQIEQSQALSLELTSLKERKSRLITECGNLEDTFNSYQRSVVQRDWQSGIGNSYESLKTSDGKEYRGVVVRRIIPEGMEVAHESGRALISYKQLPQDIQSRFRWAEAEQLK